jgi:tyrosyl-tRNA synthetase
MNFTEELRWRGMLQDSTPGLDEHLASGVRRGYIGFDPTAPSMTIGNFVQIMLLKLFQLSGHQPIVVMGGATGRIGDPSGRDRERELKSYDELDANLERQTGQIRKFLDFDSANAATLVNNLDFYRSMNVLDFLRDVGKTLTINYMMSKEAVQKRLESGISFTEFSYQLLQAYDYEVLFSRHNCTVQMGGSDQWGNITSGTEFIRRHTGGKAYAVTTPLLTKADGSKFGKSESGNIWLDPEMTSPYRFYQFWINADDADLARYTRYFSLKSHEEIEASEATHQANPQELKRLLAEELTIRVHSEEEYSNVLRVSQLLFAKDATREHLLSMSEKLLRTVAEEIPHFTVPASLLASGVNICDLLAEHTQIVSSKGDARRAIQGNAITVNKEKITGFDTVIAHESLLRGKYLMVENGKKNKYMLVMG